MSTTIEDKVVKLSFDSKDFDKGITHTKKELSTLEKQIKMEDGIKALSTLQASFNKLDLSNFSKSINNIESRLSKFGIAGAEIVRTMTDNMLSSFTNLYSTTLGQIKSGGKARATNIENAHFLLQGLLSTEEEVQKVMDVAMDSVDGTAYGFDAAAKAAAQFTASGLSTEELIGPLKAIAGVAATTSSDYESLSHIFTKVAGTGRAMTLELNQLSGYGINAASSIADYLNKVADGTYKVNDAVKKDIEELTNQIGKTSGITEKEVRTNAESGLISFRIFSDAMAQTFGDHAKKANETLTGALSNVKAALSRIGAEFYSPLIKQNGPLVQMFNNLREFINQSKTMLMPYITKLLSIVIDVINAISSIADVTSHKVFINLPKFIGSINDGMFILENILDQLKPAFEAVFGKVTFVDTLNKIIDLVNTVTYSIQAYTAEITSTGGKLYIPFVTFFKLLKAGQTIILKAFDIGRFILNEFVKSIKEIFGSNTISNIGNFADKIIKVVSSFKMTEKQSEYLALIIKTIVKSAYDAIQIIKAIIKFITKIFIAIQPLIAIVLDILFKIKDIPEIILLVGTRIKDIIQNISIKIINTIEGIRDKISIFKDMIFNRKTESNIFNSTTKDVDTLNNKISILDSIVNTIKSAFTKIKNTISSVFTFIFTKITGVSIDTSSFINNIKNIFIKIKDGLSEGFKYILDLNDGNVIKTLSDILTAIGNFILQLSGAGLLKSGSGLLDNLSKPLQSLSKTISSFSKIKDPFNSISSFFTDLKKNNVLKKDFSTKLRALATSILLISVSLFVLSKIDSGKLDNCIGAIMSLMLILSSAMIAMTRFGGEKVARRFSKVIVAFSIGILILSYSLKILAKIDPNKIGNALLTIMALMFMMVAVVLALSNFSGKMPKVNAFIILFAISIKMLVSSLIKITEIDPNKIGNALLTIMALMFMMVAVVLALSNFSGKTGLISTAIGLILLAKAVGMLVTMLVTLSKIKLKTLAKGMLFLILCMGTLIGLIMILSLLGPSLMIGVTLLLMLGAAIALLGAGVFLLVSAIIMMVGSITLLITSLPLIKTFLIGLGAIVIDILINIIRNIIHNLAAIAKDLLNEIILLAPLIKTALIVLTDLALAILDKVIYKLLTYLEDNIYDLTVKIVNIIIELLSGVADSLEERTDEIANIFSKIVLSLIKIIFLALKTIGYQLFLWIKKYCKSIWTWFKKKTGIASPSKLMKKVGIYLIQGLINGIASLIDGVKNIFKSVINACLDGLKWLGDNPIADWIVDKINNVWDFISKPISDMKDIGSSIINGIFDGLDSLNLGDKALELVNSIKDAFDGIEDFFEDAFSPISDAWDTIKNINNPDAYKTQNELYAEKFGLEEYSFDDSGVNWGTIKMWIETPEKLAKAWRNGFYGGNENLKKQVQAYDNLMQSLTEEQKNAMGVIYNTGDEAALALIDGFVSAYSGESAKQTLEKNTMVLAEAFKKIREDDYININSGILDTERLEKDAAEYGSLMASMVGDTATDEIAKDISEEWHMSYNEALNEALRIEDSVKEQLGIESYTLGSDSGKSLASGMEDGFKPELTASINVVYSLPDESEINSSARLFANTGANSNYYDGLLSPDTINKMSTGILSAPTTIEQKINQIINSPDPIDATTVYRLTNDALKNGADRLNIKANNQLGFMNLAKLRANYYRQYGTSAPF